MAVTVFIKDITNTHHEPNHSIPIQLESDYIYIYIYHLSMRYPNKIQLSGKSCWQ